MNEIEQQIERQIALSKHDYNVPTNRDVNSSEWKQWFAEWEIINRRIYTQCNRVKMVNIAKSLREKEFR